MLRLLSLPTAIPGEASMPPLRRCQTRWSATCWPSSTRITTRHSRRPTRAREIVCCLLVLNLVSSTLSCIRQPHRRRRRRRRRGGGGGIHPFDTYSLYSYSMIVYRNPRPCASCTPHHVHIINNQHDMRPSAIICRITCI